MSAQIDPMGGGTPVDPAAQAQANASASARANAGVQNMMTQGVKNMADLEKIAPEVANAMKQAIAQTIMNKMEKHMARMKEIHRQGEQDARG